MLLPALAATSLAIIVAILLIAIPGLIVLVPLRGGLIPRFALGAAAAVSSIGIAGVVFGALGIPFQAWQPVLVALVLAAGTWLVARRWGRARLPRGDEGRGTRLLVVASWIAAVGVVLAVVLSGLASFDRISQTYDNVFHLSAVAAILQNGDASSLTLRTVIETDRSFAFYPSGWHSLVALVVQLTGVGIPVAANAVWIAVVAMVWLPGVAWLAQVCLRRFPSAVVALVAFPLAAAFGWMPYGLLTWGTLYPTFLATALVPVAVAIPVATWIRLRRERSTAQDSTAQDSMAQTATVQVAGARWRTVVVGGGGVAIALLAIAFAQPRVGASWLVIVAIPALGIAGASVVRALRQGGRARRRMLWIVAAAVAGALVVAGVAFFYLVTRLGLFDRPLDDRLGGPQAQATQSVLAGLWQVLSVSTQTGVAGVVTWPAVLLAAAVAVGAVSAVRVRSWRWIVFGYGVFGILYALAAGSDDIVSKLLTAVWYKDRYRLSATLPVLGVVLATLGILVVAGWVARRGERRSETPEPRRRIAGLAAALAWIVTVVSTITLAATGMTSAIAAVFTLPDGPPGSAVVSKAQIAFIAALDEFVPEGERILGDPWDGSALTWVFGDREPVFPHVNGQWDADRQTLAWSLGAIEDEQRVCDALDRLRVRFVLYNPHVFGGGDPSGNHFPGPHQAVDAGLFTAVATDGDSTLYRIDQCGDLPG